MHNKLLIVGSEPPEDAKFKTSIVKRLTGGKKFSSLELFSSQTQLNIRGKTIVDSNHRLPFQYEINNALIRRLIDYKFPNVFTEDEKKIGTKTLTSGEHKRINEFYKSQEFKDTYKISMMHILLDLFKQTNGIVVIPEIINKKIIGIFNWNALCSKMVLLYLWINWWWYDEQEEKDEQKAQDIFKYISIRDILSRLNESIYYIALNVTTKRKISFHYVRDLFKINELFKDDYIEAIDKTVNKVRIHSQIYLKIGNW